MLAQAKIPDATLEAAWGHVGEDSGCCCGRRSVSIAAKAARVTVTRSHDRTGGVLPCSGRPAPIGRGVSRD